MNRIRNSYLQLAPELEPYFVTSRYDDDAGVLESTIADVGPIPRYQVFVSAPGVVAATNSVVAGAVAGVAAMALDLGTAWSLVAGGVLFLASIGFFVIWARGRVGRFLSGSAPLFPPRRPKATEALLARATPNDGAAGGVTPLPHPGILGRRASESNSYDAKTRRQRDQGAGAAGRGRRTRSMYGTLLTSIPTVPPRRWSQEGSGTGRSDPAISSTSTK